MDFYRPIKFFKNIWWFLLANYVWGGLVSIYYNPRAFEGFEYFLPGSLYGFAISASYVYGFILIWIEMDKRYHWIKQTGKRIFFGLFYGELYAILSFAMVSMLYGLWVGKGDFSFGIQAFLYAWMIPAINFLPSLLIVCAVAFFKNWSTSVVNREKLKAEMMQYKFESLQNQLNPHFLFNSFNVLSQLVYDDKTLAKKFIDQLNEMYRYVLASKDRTLVPLEEELGFIESYCFLLKARFENQLNIDISLDPANDEQIAPMVLQLLIENAVKHNAFTSKQPLTIRIQREGDYVMVINNLNLKKQSVPSTKTGLANIRQRYGLLTESEVRIEQNNVEFKVSIPLIRKEGRL